MGESVQSTVLCRCEDHLRSWADSGSTYLKVTRPLPVRLDQGWNPLRTKGDFPQDIRYPLPEYGILRTDMSMGIDSFTTDLGSLQPFRPFFWPIFKIGGPPRSHMHCVHDRIDGGF